jgi:nucleotide-binding universal stress UspA family protein
MIVMVAIRIGAGSLPAVEAAVQLSDRLGADLRLVYVSEELEAVDDLAEAAGQTPEEARRRMIAEITERCHEELGDPLPGRAQLIVREGDVAQGVTNAAVELAADLIVVGMKGRSTFAKLVLGDATGAILERAPCPVVVIPPAIAHPSG